MRGHEPLVAMRLRRRKPAMVSITVGAACWVADHWQEVDGVCPHLLVEPADALERLDLRFLVGVPLVDVSGHEDVAERVKAVFDACVSAGAQRVLGAIHRPTPYGLEAIEYLDTAGVLTWLE